MSKIGASFLGLALAASLFTPIAGCGSSSAGSCAQSSGGAVVSCSDYGEGYTTAQVMTSCSGAGGTYSSSACPSENRVARCAITVSAAGVTATTTVSYYPPLTVANVMQSCSQANIGGGVTATFTAN